MIFDYEITNYCKHYMTHRIIIIPNIIQYLRTYVYTFVICLLDNPHSCNNLLIVYD